LASHSQEHLPDRGGWSGSEVGRAAWASGCARNWVRGFQLRFSTPESAERRPGAELTGAISSVSSGQAAPASGKAADAHRDDPGVSIAILDGSVVSVALPSIQRILPGGLREVAASGARGSAPAGRADVSSPSTQAGGPPTRDAATKSVPSPGSHRNGQCVVSSFDRVQHDALMARVARRVHDKRVLRLIRRYLEAGVMEGGLARASEEGTPQGSPLSPLLSNVRRRRLGAGTARAQLRALRRRRTDLRPQ
jgi:hypothetical protein